MTYTRRDLGKIALSAVPAATLLAKPNSKFGGVQIGIITYSFRAMSGKAEDILKNLVDLGLNSVEMMSEVAESFAGAPSSGRRGSRTQLTPEQQEAQRRAV